VKMNKCCESGKWIRRQMDIMNRKTHGRMILCLKCGVVHHRWNEK